jgi:hypothetical protein
MAKAPPTLKIETLGKADPEQVLMLNAQIRQMIDDCYDRSSLEKARTLTITISTVPKEHGGTVYIDSEISGKLSLPANPGRVIQGKYAGPGTLVFNPASPDQVDQATLDQVE